jgi:hypothetical protein
VMVQPPRPTCPPEPDARCFAQVLRFVGH